MLVYESTSVTKVSFNANKFLPFESGVEKVRRVTFLLQNWYQCQLLYYRVHPFRKTTGTKWINFINLLDLRNYQRTLHFEGSLPARYYSFLPSYFYPSFASLLAKFVALPLLTS